MKVTKKEYQEILKDRDLARQSKQDMFDEKRPFIAFGSKEKLVLQYLLYKYSEANPKELSQRNVQQSIRLFDTFLQFTNYKPAHKFKHSCYMSYTTLTKFGFPKNATEVKKLWKPLVEIGFLKVVQLNSSKNIYFPMFERQPSKFMPEATYEDAVEYFFNNCEEDEMDMLSDEENELLAGILDEWEL